MHTIVCILKKCIRNVRIRIIFYGEKIVISTTHSDQATCFMRYFFCMCLLQSDMVRLRYLSSDDLNRRNVIGSSSGSLIGYWCTNLAEGYR